MTGYVHVAEYNEKDKRSSSRKIRSWLMSGAVLVSVCLLALFLYYQSSSGARNENHNDRATFFVLGDFGVDETDPVFAEHLKSAIQVSRSMYTIAKQNQWPRAVFLTGDLAYPSGISHESDTKIDRIFQRIPTRFRENVEFYATPGNHDCEGSVHAWSRVRDHRITPWKAPQGGGRLFGENRFKLPSGRLRLITLETCSLVWTPLSESAILNHRCGDKMSKYAEQPHFRKDKLKQLEWLRTVEDKQPGEWLIVMTHWPVYSFRGNGPTRELHQLLLWMREKRVDFVLSGHDHALQLIRGGNSMDPVFLVSGAGGYPLHPTLKDDSEALFNTEGGAVLAHVQDESGFMSLEVTEDEAVLRFINLNGSETFRTIIERKP